MTSLLGRNRSALWLKITLVLVVALSLLPSSATAVEPETTAQDLSGTIAYARNWPSAYGYYGHSHLYTIRPDGTDEAALWDGYYATTPAWSPDGTKVAFSMTDGRSFDIYVMDLSGPAPSTRRLFITPEHQELYPSWSPDGKRLAYVRWWVDREAPAWAPRMESSIWTVKLDGTDRRRITRGPSPYEQTPKWSPVGPWIAFGRRDNDEPGSPWHLYVVRSDGKKIRRLTHGNLRSWGPDWSPDGKHIAFTGTMARADETARLNASGVYVIPARGGEATFLTEAATYDRVCWSPDGARIAYSVRAVDLATRVSPNQQTSADLYSVKADGSDVRRITFTPHASEHDCDWTA